MSSHVMHGMTRASAYLCSVVLAAPATACRRAARVGARWPVCCLHPAGLAQLQGQRLALIALQPQHRQRPVGSVRCTHQHTERPSVYVCTIRRSVSGTVCLALRNGPVACTWPWVAHVPGLGVLALEHLEHGTTRPGHCWSRPPITHHTAASPCCRVCVQARVCWRRRCSHARRPCTFSFHLNARPLQ